MSLMAESPVQSSSSSDDFAAFLDTELEVASSSSSPDDEEVDNAGESDIEESSNKRRKVDSEDTKDVAVKDSTGPSSDGEDMGKCPPHPGFIKGLCILCGQLEDDNGSAVAFGYIHKDLKLARKEISRLRGADLTTVLREKKLILILDLDHTLLNSTRLVDISMEEQYLLRQAEILQNDSQRSLVKLDGMHMLTKFRPFVHTFLKEASTIFEMYVYTMAERSYALEIANILDPERVYFNSKVITQSDSTQRNQKGLDVVLGAESVVVILDDTEFVWDKHKENLILMERYHFFASSCRQHGSSVRSLSELKQDESDSNGALATILNVLKRTHQTFFNPVGVTIEELFCFHYKKIFYGS
ncbi:RNA polymerase II C-terminal domain phosphatase-like 4 [Apostasia shenzhenica]|uniref:RNA polymerase II C-terminal domain phosphatase-like n=1 Tax=Apostasia shenzhenica TaxID=1088818 RepID=A0A2I0A521_9ASPA|nr:RNA polymerase II C-terminal domain phosphatase-like 4 [Apostasia shenzhenica]